MSRAKEMREMPLGIDANTTGNITVTGDIDSSNGHLVHGTQHFDGGALYRFYLQVVK